MEEVDFFLLPRRQLLEGTPVNTFGVVFSLCWMAGVLALCIIYIVSLHPHATRRWLLSCCCHKHQTGRPNNNLPHGPKRLHTAPALLKHAHQDGTYLELPVTHHGLVEVPLDTPHASPVRPANESEEPVQVKEEYTYLGRHSTQQGYQDHLPGTLLLSLLAVTSLLPIAGLFFITLSSYYFYIPGADFVQLSYFFILAWHVMTAWLLALWAIKDRLRNLFRLPVPLDVATYVELTRRDKLNLAGRLPSRNRCAAAMRWLLSIAHMGEEDSSLSRETVKVKVDTVHAGERFFNFRLQRYSYNRAMGCFTAVVPDLGRLRSDFHRLADRGLSDAKRSERLSLLGVNRLSIPQPSLTDSLLEEFASFFYLCTFSLLWLLFLVHYWKVGIVIVVLLILSGSVRVYQARKSLLEMEELAKVVGHSDVFTGWDDSGRRQWASIDNTSLVAGDVIRLQRGPVSADLVLVSGSARVDEASLTGESLPALKLSVPNTDEPYQAKTGDIKSTIFAGTLVTNSSGPAGPGDDGEQAEAAALAVVVSTGGATDRGKFLQQLLFSPPLRTCLDEEVEAVVVILALVAFGTIVFIMCLAESLSIFTWIQAVIILLGIMPPMLPVLVTLTMTYNQASLKRQRVLTATGDSKRLLLAGWLETWCFDKTGTLTKEGLEYAGVVPVRIGKSESSFQFPVNWGPAGSAKGLSQLLTAEMADLPALLRAGMGCCHSLRQDASGKLIGNPVDVEMFTATGWEFQMLSAHARVSSRQEDVVWELVRVFDFDHARKSSAVVAKKCAASGTTAGHEKKDELYLFLKGAYESVYTCVVGGGGDFSLPAEYEAVTQHLASNGCYTLALAARAMPMSLLAEPSLLSKLSLEAATAREFAGASPLQLLALLAFRNELKPETPAAIAALRAGGCHTVMITGDNVLTAMCAAKAAGLVDKEQNYLLARVVQPPANPPEATYSVSPSPPSRAAGDAALFFSPSPSLAAGDAALFEQAAAPPCASAVARPMGKLQQLGSVRDILEATSPIEIHLKICLDHMPKAPATPSVTANSLVSGAPQVVWEHPDSGTRLDPDDHGADGIALAVSGEAFQVLKASGELERLLPRFRVFARMTPQDKVNCVQMYMKRGITGMVGDGGNDCGALRVAHVGLALSDAEASMVAPFTSLDKTVMSAELLTRMGRATMMSVLAEYKFLLIFAITYSFCIMSFSYFVMLFGEFQWILRDVLISMPLGLAMTLAKEPRILSPHIPTSHLLSPAVVYCMVTHVLIDWSFMIGAIALLYHQVWFKGPPSRDWLTTNGGEFYYYFWGDNFETEVLYAMTMFNNIHAALAFSFGHQYRSAWYRNVSFVVVYITVTVFYVVLVATESTFTCIFRTNCDVSYEKLYGGYFNNTTGNNIMPNGFQGKLLALMWANAGITLLIENFAWWNH